MRYLIVAAVALAGSASAQETTVTRAEGLEAWERIYEVAVHPRCTNCHVGAQAEPMWSGLSYGETAVHGMNVKADESRIGAETIPCRTCHVTSDAPNVLPNAAPHIDEAWRLPPVELDWLDKASVELCAQLRNPDTNDGHDIEGLVEHLETSAFVAWGFEPGGGRSAPPGTPASMAADVAIWGAAGTPCE